MPELRTELLWRRRILLGALWEQKVLCEEVPRYGYDPHPWEDNVKRLSKRLIAVQKEIDDHGLD